MKCLIFLMLAFWSSNVFAVTINAGSTPYNNVVAAQGVNINSEGEVRAAAMLALVGAYRAIHGIQSISMPSQVQIVYDDGSKEKAVVTCIAGTPCVQPVPNTQQPPSSGGGGGGGGLPNPGGGEGGGASCHIGTEPRQACTSAGGGAQYCQWVFVDTLVC